MRYNVVLKSRFPGWKVGILTILLTVLSSAAFAQNESENSHQSIISSPYTIDNGSVEITNPATGEKGTLTFSTLPLGNIQDASPEQLRELSKDLKENLTTQSDGILTIVQKANGDLPPAAFTEGLTTEKVVVPQSVYGAEEKLKIAEGISDQNPEIRFGIQSNPANVSTVVPRKPYFDPSLPPAKRVWSGLQRVLGEPTVNDWVVGMVFFATPRATMAYFFMAQHHSVGFAAFWAGAVGVTTIANNIFHRPLDEWATRGTSNPDRSVVNSDRMKIWYRFWKWDLLTDYMLNIITRKNTLTQVFLDSFPRLFNNAVSVQKSLLFKGSRNLRMTYTLIPLVVTTAIQQVNNTIEQPIIWSAHFGQNAVLDFLNMSNSAIWEFRPTTILSLTTYAILFGVNLAAPDWVVKQVTKLEKKVMPFRDWVSKGVVKLFGSTISPDEPCRNLLRGEKDPVEPKESPSDDLQIGDETHGGF